MRQSIVPQYQAALTMMESCITSCPESLWHDSSHKNPYWKIVYHSLFYTSLYLSKNDMEFIPWYKHRAGANRLEQVSSFFYTQEELLKYTTDLKSSVGQYISDESMFEPSGFDWLIMNRLELYIYNLRHLQHHTGQLVERLRQYGTSGISWK